MHVHIFVYMHIYAHIHKFYNLGSKFTCNFFISAINRFVISLAVRSVDGTGGLYERFRGKSHNSGLRWASLSAIHVRAKAICERSVLFPGPRGSALWVAMPLVSTAPQLTLQLFLDFLFYLSHSLPK